MSLKSPHWYLVFAFIVLFLFPSSTILLAHDHSDDCENSFNSVPMHDHDGCGDGGGTEEPPDDGGGTEEPPDDGGGDPEPPVVKPTPKPKPSSDHEHHEQLPPPQLALSYECSAAGTSFTIINYGGDMQSVEHYTLGDGTSGEYQLPWQQNTTITTGFGAASIDAGAAGSLLVECQRPPELTISGVCVPQSGVVFTIRNSGGPMPQRQAYTINNAVTDSFRLDAGGQVDIPAGFGDPVFFSEGLITRLGSICAPSGRITGTIWSDVDGDGLRSPDEPGLADMEVMLRSDGDPVTVKTAPDGTYAFEVVPGSYHVTAAPQADFVRYLTLTADPDGVLDGATGITIGSGDSATAAADFGYQPTQTGSIGGAVWLETGDFGRRDSGETGLAGVDVQLLDAGGRLLRTVSIQADGRYEFADLPPEQYTLYVDTSNLPARTFPTYDRDGDLDFTTTLFLHAGEALEDIEFGIVGPF